MPLAANFFSGAAAPGQAVVRYEDSKLIVRQRARSVVAVRADANGTQAFSYEVRSTVCGKSTDSADVAVFDMKGHRVAEKVWKEKLKTDQHVLLAQEGKLPHPRELALFKDDTLVVVLPVHTTDLALPPANVEQFMFRRATTTGEPVESLPAPGVFLGKPAQSLAPAPPSVPAPPKSPAATRSFK